LFACSCVRACVRACVRSLDCRGLARWACNPSTSTPDTEQHRLSGDTDVVLPCALLLCRSRFYLPSMICQHSRTGPSLLSKSRAPLSRRRTCPHPCPPNLASSGECHCAVCYLDRASSFTLCCNAMFSMSPHLQISSMFGADGAACVTSTSQLQHRCPAHQERICPGCRRERSAQKLYGGVALLERGGSQVLYGVLPKGTPRRVQISLGQGAYDAQRPRERAQRPPSCQWTQPHDKVADARASVSHMHESVSPSPTIRHSFTWMCACHFCNVLALHWNILIVPKHAGMTRLLHSSLQRSRTRIGLPSLPGVTPQRPRHLLARLGFSLQAT